MLYWKVYIGRQTCFLVPLPHLCPASQVCHRAWYCCFCFYIHRGLRLSCHFSPSLVDWFRSISLFQVWYLAKKKKNHQKTDSKHMLEISGVRVTLRWNFFQVKISFRIKDTSVKIWQLKKKCWEFPGSPVVRTWRFQDWRAWAQSLAQEIRSCKPCSMAKKKKRHCEFMGWKLRLWFLSKQALSPPPLWISHSNICCPGENPCFLWERKNAFNFLLPKTFPDVGK